MSKMQMIGFLLRITYGIIQVHVLVYARQRIVHSVCLAALPVMLRGTKSDLSMTE